ncbi:MAG: response regulator transcription factor [Bacteroidota bacterium]|nr:response regulator transcription factor [Bacteroidota bacterium]MDP4215866.1 response regulator transcription factor [Bacteroidota bacterium]MDP4246578.1 response regulator transcription factor [Bacteroidota bacterium]MDP4254012.1 response regulator transcription factor [Bacteroidota bacterium]MDP4258399.1 response regulator transcription factor [Bacteroidota bacterium]
MTDIKILLVEDEKKIAETLRKGLSEQHYDVDIAYDGQVGKQLFDSNNYDLAILDINLPLMNGYELSRHIRSRNEQILVIMLTAMNTTEDKIEGFEAGADDYIVKPFDFQELLVRIRALLKRLHQQPQQGSNVLKVGDLVMNLDSKEVTREGKLISLTAKEFQLLEYFIRNKNKVVSRIDIAMNVWDIDFDTKTNVIDVYVNFLRKKIEKDFSSKLIYTQVGMGYVLKENS